MAVKAKLALNVSQNNSSSADGTGTVPATFSVHRLHIIAALMLTIAAAEVLLIPILHAEEADRRSPPNIVLILTDDKYH